MTDEATVQVTQIIERIGKVAALTADDDFYAAGFSSITALELLIELEAVFEVNISDEEFIRCRNSRQVAGMIIRLQEKVSA